MQCICSSVPNTLSHCNPTYRRLEEEKAAQKEEGGSQEERRGSLWDDHPKEAVTFFVHLQAIKRNKRHLLIYA